MSSPPGRRRAPTPAGRTHLLRAARLGSRAARADLADDAERARSALRASRRLRRTVLAGEPRQAVQMAFDTGYGQQMQRVLARPVPVRR